MPLECNVKPGAKGWILSSWNETRRAMIGCSNANDWTQGLRNGRLWEWSPQGQHALSVVASGWGAFCLLAEMKYLDPVKEQPNQAISCRSLRNLPPESSSCILLSFCHRWSIAWMIKKKESIVADKTTSSWCSPAKRCVGNECRNST